MSATAHALPGTPAEGESVEATKRRAWLPDEALAALKAKHPAGLYAIEPEKFGGLGVVFRKPTKIEFMDYASVMKTGASVGDLTPKACDLALAVIVFPDRTAVYAHLEEYDLLANKVAGACAQLRSGEDLTVAKKL